MIYNGGKVILGSYYDTSYQYGVYLQNIRMKFFKIFAAKTKKIRRGWGSCMLCFPVLSGLVQNCQFLCPHFSTDELLFFGFDSHSLEISWKCIGKK